MNQVKIPIRSGSQKNGILLENVDFSISYNESLGPETPKKEQIKKLELGEFAVLQTEHHSSLLKIENEKKAKDTQDSQKMFLYPQTIKEIRIPFDKFSFIFTPIKKTGIVQCSIRKICSQSFTQNAKYEFLMFDLPILYAEKIQSIFKRKFIIKLSGQNQYAGKIKWDKTGVNFIFFDNKLNPKKCTSQNMKRKCIGAATYEKTGKKKPHKIRFYLPEVNQQNEVYEYSLEQLKPFDKIPKNFQEFQNREPEYSEEEKTFVLPYYNRAKVASSKNIQVCQAEKNEIQLLLGKVSKGMYNLDFQWPIFPIQAFQIALSCFVSRASD